MPELPEVETTRRGIAPYLVGATLLRVDVRNARLRWPVSADIMTLHHQPILQVKRRAKYLLLELPTGWIIIHLGMSGSLRVLPEDVPAGKHDHIDLILTNTTRLRYTDPRRFGAWLWCTDDPLTSRLLSHLGPEPLSDDFNADYLFSSTRGKRIAIKLWLMEAKWVVGVGNIYASEALFCAGILPTRLAMSLNETDAANLVSMVRSVLARAIEQGGTTLRDFSQSDGKPGYFAQALQVYGRAGEPCYNCLTPILRCRQAQRTTFWCPDCQK